MFIVKPVPNRRGGFMILSKIQIFYLRGEGRGGGGPPVGVVKCEEKCGYLVQVCMNFVRTWVEIR